MWQNSQKCLCTKIEFWGAICKQERYKIYKSLEEPGAVNTITIVYDKSYRAFEHDDCILSYKWQQSQCRQEKASIFHDSQASSLEGATLLHSHTHQVE